MKIFLLLLAREYKLELRKRSVLAGLLIYLTATVFIGYLVFRLRENLMTPLVWSAFFWIVILFTAVNCIAKSFMGEHRARDIYYYSIAGPEEIILSKIVYNFLLCTLLSFAGYGLFVIFFGNPMANTLLFCGIVILVAAGFATSLTLISAIAAKANNGNILMAVLSFPVVISIMLLAIKATKNCIDDLDPSVTTEQIVILLAINCLIGAMSFLLFPYIWRS